MQTAVRQELKSLLNCLLFMIKTILIDDEMHCLDTLDGESLQRCIDPYFFGSRKKQGGRCNIH